MPHSNRLGASTDAKGQDVAEADFSARIHPSVSRCYRNLLPWTCWRWCPYNYRQPVVLAAPSASRHSRGMPLGRRKIPERYYPDLIVSLSPKSHPDCFEGLVMGRTSKFAVVRTVIDRFDCDEDPRTVLMSTWSAFLLGIPALLNRHVIDVGEQENPPAASCQGRDLHQERNTPTRASATPAAAKAACAPGNVMALPTQPRSTKIRGPEWAQPKSESFRTTESLMGELQRGQGNDLIARLLVDMSRGRDVFDQDEYHSIGRRTCQAHNPTSALLDVIPAGSRVETKGRQPEIELSFAKARTSPQTPIRRSAAAATPEEQSSATTTTLESALSNWTQITLDVICVALSRANSLWISAARSDDPTTEELDEILVQNISTSIVSVASAVSAGPSPLDKTSAGSNTSRDLTLAKEVPKSLSGDKDVPPAWLTPLQLSDASDSWANPLLPTDEESVICPSAPPSSGPAASRPLACARCSTCSGSTNVHVTSCYRDIISSPSGKRQGLIRSGDDLLLSTSWASSASEIGRNNCHEALER
ncbi:hypothetical protein IWX46DRAFT_577847 [Phyllosticta citricarpa]|uniref:Uncharacterized protein n=1 Tax=Phyllosticta citricarpa TaxID=55181 RepID=A0ABR1MQ36_9PEZI